METVGDALSWRTVLAPAARVGQNVLADILERQGAQVRLFPTLSGHPPEDPGPVDRALGELDAFAWIVFAGELAARFFLDRRGGAGRLPAKVLAIGQGASEEVSKRLGAPDAAPRAHTAAAVADALGELDGRRVLLVRGDRASPRLPAELARRGARVTDVIGFEVRVEASRDQARVALSPPPEVLAFGNPSAVRLFSAALGELDLDPLVCLAGVVVAAVGPATAREAVGHGLPPDLTSAGHLADLVADLQAIYRVE